VTSDVPRGRGIFTNRTLNLRSIKAIGYDMDYTLIHYAPKAWERRAYEHLKQRFADRGFPVADLEFDPDLATRGLIIDTELGNIVKANRFGYVKRACHGTRLLEFDEQRAAYSRTIIDLAEPRWSFLNTFFSLSEACMYAQLVELLDAKKLPGTLGYGDLYRLVKTSLDAAHMEGELKAEVMAAPDRFVVLDPEAPLALLDQKRAGKKLMLITNSEWTFTSAMLTYAFDPFLPGMTWRELFDVIIVSARKPEFFASRSPLFQVVSEDGLLKPTVHGLEDHGVYLGGNAALVEKKLGFSGDEILYVGDHIYGDVKVSKSVLRWRTALILRELEDEIEALDAARSADRELTGLMVEKEALERAQCNVRLELLRRRADYGPRTETPREELEAELARLKNEVGAIDDRAAPLARAASERSSERWGLLMRAGNDKSHLARQLERSADVYTSRVSNFLHATPFVYLRSSRGSLPHD
jgi:HAD superfamily 5'-nucleotidase-like hydrolase